MPLRLSWVDLDACGYTARKMWALMHHNF